MVDVRFITPEEIPQFRRAVAFGFGEDLVEEEGGDQRFAEVFPTKTSIAAFDNDDIVATFGSFDLDMTVPGGTIPMAGTTIVTVHSTHRRRGILTKMMRLHLEQAMSRHQPVAGLWASEFPIYGRFGYGEACLGIRLVVDARTTTLPPPPPDITLRQIDKEEAERVLPGVYERVRTTRPGLYARSPAWWTHRKFRDPEHWRDGASAQRIVLAERGNTPVGFILYRQKSEWKNDLSDGSIVINDLISTDEEARRALWSFATSIDLFPNVRMAHAPVDEPLLIEAGDPRQLGQRVEDTLWIRLLDIPAALMARRYERDGQLTLSIDDDFLSSGGTFALNVTDGAARVERTDGPADLTMDVRTLGALYMGGRSAVQFARAGRITGDPSASSGQADCAVQLLDGVFRTARAPSCVEVF